MTEITNNVDEAIPYFGGCPRCRKNDGCVNIGRDHWFFCEEHKTKWCVGSILWPVPNEVQDEWRDAAALLEGYTKVEPLRNTWDAVRDEIYRKQHTEYLNAGVRVKVLT